MGRDLRRTLVQPPARNKSAARSQQVSQGFIQSGLESFQGWRLKNTFGELFLLPDCSRWEKPVKMSPFRLDTLSLLLPCTTMKSAWLSLLGDLIVGVGVRSPGGSGCFLLVRVQLAVYRTWRSSCTEMLPKWWSSVCTVARGSGVLPFQM